MAATKTSYYIENGLEKLNIRNEQHDKEYNDNPKTLVFTHTDLDGVTCAALIKLIIPNATLFLCDYNNINEIMSEVYEDYCNNTLKLNTQVNLKIFITDISPKELNINARLLMQSASELVVIDHHKTSEWMQIMKNNNKVLYIDALEDDHTNHVIIDENDLINSLCKETKLSATAKLYYYLREYYDAFPDNLISYNVFKNIVIPVNAYDTWTWGKSFPNDDLIYYITRCRALILNQLLNNIGAANFISRVQMYNLHLINDVCFSFELKEIGEYLANFIDEIVNLKDSQITFKTFVDYPNAGELVKCALFTLPNDISDLSLASYVISRTMRNEKFNDVKILALTKENTNGVSLRLFQESENDYSDIDLSVIAKRYNGGGHATAAGCEKSKFLNE